jgi:hypothetical protein
MKELLTTGDTIELVKDCDCITHEGPHWLHMDRLTHQMNRRMLDRNNTQGFMSAEIVRLEEKERNMVRLGIEEIVG